MGRFCHAGEQVDCPSTPQAHPLHALDSSECTCCTGSENEPLMLLQPRASSLNLRSKRSWHGLCLAHAHISLGGARSSSEALKIGVTVTEEHEIKNPPKAGRASKTMKMHPNFFLTIATCVAFGAASFAGCKKEAEEPEPEVTTGAEAPPTEPEPVQVEELPCELQVVYFALDSAELDDAARTTIQEAVECFRAQGTNRSLLLTGACDPRGAEEYNIALGEGRASAVRDYMRSLGWTSGQLSITSVGEEMATGTDEASWAQDRHVAASGK